MPAGTTICEAGSPDAGGYARRRAEEMPLYRLVREHWAALRSALEEAGHELPAFVAREFEDYLRCGRLEHGFVRVKCEGCRHEKLVAFSCKRRGFCPSCGGRRMAETAAFLADEVFPHQALRQWVITFPFELRFLFAARPEVMGSVLGIVNRAISGFIVRRARSANDVRAGTVLKTGAVTFIQRFGSALNLNIHFHMLYLDGAYGFAADEEAAFHRAPAPSRDELQALFECIVHRVARHLERHGWLVREEGVDPHLALDDASAFDSVLARAVTWRVATGPREGRKALTVSPSGRESPTPEHDLAVRTSGFSLHAATVCEADEREQLERLCRLCGAPQGPTHEHVGKMVPLVRITRRSAYCRYVSRPALANERLSFDGDGMVRYELKRAFRDGTTHVVLDPLEFLSRLAALVPRPRVNLVRYHGLFAPNCRERARVVGPVARRTRNDDESPRRSACLGWALRLHRVFAIDVRQCPSCGGRLRVIACIEEPGLIKQILAHLGEGGAHRDLGESGARGPPQPCQEALILHGGR